MERNRRLVILIVSTILCGLLLYFIGPGHSLREEAYYDIDENTAIAQYGTLKCDYEQEIKQDFIANTYYLKGINYVLVGIGETNTGEMSVTVHDLNGKKLAENKISYQDIKVGEWQNLSLDVRVQQGERYAITFQNLSQEVTPFILTGQPEVVSKYSRQLWNGVATRKDRLYIGYGFSPQVPKKERILWGTVLVLLLLRIYYLVFKKEKQPYEIKISVNTYRVKKKNAHVIIGAVLGAIGFFVIYGTKVLQPTYVDWLFNGMDLAQHYLGWKFYRTDAWTWPLGMIQSIAYPAQASIIFTDSIPLFALIGKAISSIFSIQTDFQYFGIWGLLCMMLQGAIAAKILEKYLHSSMDICLGTIFFIFSPILMYRMYYHTSLAAQWIILLSIYMVCDYKTLMQTKKGIVYCCLIGFLCASIHIYYIPMCGAFIFVYAILHARDSHKWMDAIIDLAGFLVTIVVTIYIFGGFTGGASATSSGLSKFGMNLNAFWNPLGYSVFLSDAPVNFYSKEGFNYLGLGMIVLFLFTLIHILVAKMLRKSEKKVNVLRYGLVCFVSIILLIAAMSPAISFNDTLLVELKLPEMITTLWSIFRAAGRLAWPVYYLIMIFAICGDREHIFKSTKTILLCVCVIIQLVDLHQMIAEKHTTFSTEQSYTSFLEEAEWQEILQQNEYKHFVFLTDIIYDQEELYAFADYASDHDITINNFYFARDVGADVDETIAQLLAQPESNYLFIAQKEEKEAYENLNIPTYEIGNYVIASVNGFN